MPGFDTNDQFASLLRQMGRLLEEDGVQFKPAAYRKAAITIENLDRDIFSFSTIEELKELPGIGDAIASKVLEFKETGHIRHLEDLILKMEQKAKPPAPEEKMDLPF